MNSLPRFLTVNNVGPAERLSVKLLSEAEGCHRHWAFLWDVLLKSIFDVDTPLDIRSGVRKELEAVMELVMIRRDLAYHDAIELRRMLDLQFAKGLKDPRLRQAILRD